MTENLRIFVDFWNFQISWNDRTNKAPLDWTKFSHSRLIHNTKFMEALGRLMHNRENIIIFGFHHI